MMRIAAAASIVVVGCLAMTGCRGSGYHPDASVTAAEVTGIWQGNGASIDFRADGTFISTVDLCEKDFYLDGVPTHDPSSGRWDLYDYTREYKQKVHEVSLYYDDSTDKRGCATSLRIEQRDGQIYLFTWIRDPDEQQTVTFTKVPPLFSTPTP